MKTKSTFMLNCLVAILFFTGTAWNSVYGQPLKGYCSGMVTQCTPFPYSYIVTMKLEGNTGTIEFPSLVCKGTLTFLRSDDSVYWYEEHITQGSNYYVDGGTIEIILQKKSINWWLYGSNTNVYGNLEGKLSMAGTPQRRVPYGLEGFTRKSEATNKTENGLKEGKWIHYMDSRWAITNANNAVYYRLVVYKSGIPVGIVRDYYKSGMLQSDYVMDSLGRIKGVVKWYYENSKLLCIGCFNENLLDGPYIWFFRSGNTSKIGFYSKGKKEGIWDCFYNSMDVAGKYNPETGELIKGSYYANNGNNELSQYFFSYVGLRSQRTYESGLLNGWVRWYYKNGRVWAKTLYTSGVAGKSYCWNEACAPIL
jgi:antitoxin component YwqK of YwqJK toxin-antitoxin module